MDIYIPECSWKRERAKERALGLSTRRGLTEEKLTKHFNGWWGWKRVWNLKRSLGQSCQKKRKPRGRRN